MGQTLRIAVTRKIHESEVNRLREVADVAMWDSDLPPSRDELLKHVEGADAILSLLTDRIDAEPESRQQFRRRL